MTGSAICEMLLSEAEAGTELKQMGHFLDYVTMNQKINNGASAFLLRNPRG